MRLVVQHIFDDRIVNRTQRAPRLWAALDRYLQRFMDGGLQIRQNFLPQSTNRVYNRLQEHANEAFLLRELKRLEETGEADGVVVACIADPAVREARSALNLPVVGAGEASIQLASLWGKRFAIICARPEVVPMMERTLDHYHCYSRAIHRPVRPLGTFSYDQVIDCFEGASEVLLDDFLEVAHRCIADGADVIISGCAYLGPLFTERHLTEIPGTGVPVIDCVAAAVELARGWARLRAVLPGVGPSRAPHSPYTLAAGLE